MYESNVIERATQKEMRMLQDRINVLKNAQTASQRNRKHSGGGSNSSDPLPKRLSPETP